MANMSHCRFNNTLRDLEDCRDALENGALDLETLKSDDAMSEEELRAAVGLIMLCRNLTEYFLPAARKVASKRGIKI